MSDYSRRIIDDNTNCGPDHVSFKSDHPTYPLIQQIHAQFGAQARVVQKEGLAIGIDIALQEARKQAFDEVMALIAARKQEYITWAKDAEDDGDVVRAAYWRANQDALYFIGDRIEDHFDESWEPGTSNMPPSAQVTQAEPARDDTFTIEVPR